MLTIANIIFIQSERQNVDKSIKLETTVYSFHLKRPLLFLMEKD